MVLPVENLVTGFLADGHARVATGRGMMMLLKIDLSERSLFSMMASRYARCQSLGMRTLGGIKKMTCIFLPMAGGLDLPPWAFSLSDERIDCSMSRSLQSKPALLRGVKGTMLPVVRINACVVKDHGSFVSDPRMKVRGKERYSSRSSRHYSSSSDGKRSSAEGDSQSKSVNDQGSQDSWKYMTSINAPKDHLCTVDDLQLHLGDWYYLDGSGHEQGPSSFPQLQVLVDQGIIQKHISVFRKSDKIWVPVASARETSEATVKSEQENDSAGDSSRTVSQSQASALGDPRTKPKFSHDLHPQFIGYTRGKLHELVMKSYKSREFAAAINEVLDPWINAKQPKKEMEKHIYRKSGMVNLLNFRWYPGFCLLKKRI
jgi:hypothetical protein